MEYSLYTWVKDRNFRFINCSENLCEIAGEDSPHSMTGKDDYTLIWKEGASLFRSNDIKIIKGELKQINTIETIKVTSNQGIPTYNTIMITKIPILNKKGNCIGIAGSHIKLENENSVSNKFDEKGRLWLPKSLGNLYFTKREVQVLKLILVGKTSRQVALVLGIDQRTVERYIEIIKKKLQCSSKFEIHIVVMEMGLTHLLALN